MSPLPLHRPRRPSGFSIIEVAVVIAIIGIIAAVAIPAYLRFQSRSKQSEAKTLLRLVYDAERSYFAAHEHYGLLSEVGFDPGEGSRWTIQASSDCSEGKWLKPAAAPTAGYACVTQNRTLFPATSYVATTTQPLGSFGTKPNEVFSAVALSNIDNDTRVDEWFITTGSSTFPNGGPGGCVPSVATAGAGEIISIVDDLNCD